MLTGAITFQYFQSACRRDTQIAQFCRRVDHCELDLGPSYKIAGETLGWVTIPHGFGALVPEADDHSSNPPGTYVSQNDT